MTLTRDWSDANAAKRHHCCRVCGARPIELAHVIGRRFDVRVSRTRAYVAADSVVALCHQHHGEFDASTLDLWPYLDAAERQWAVGRLGRGEAEARIRGRAWRQAA